MLLALVRRSLLLPQWEQALLASRSCAATATERYLPSDTFCPFDS
jgi:hypothetical protein